jgi:hypothetical protein
MIRWVGTSSSRCRSSSRILACVLRGGGTSRTAHRPHRAGALLPSSSSRPRSGSRGRRRAPPHAGGRQRRASRRSSCCLIARWTASRRRLRAGGAGAAGRAASGPRGSADRGVGPSGAPRHLGAAGSPVRPGGAYSATRREVVFAAPLGPAGPAGSSTGTWSAREEVQRNAETRGAPSKGQRFPHAPSPCWAARRRRRWETDAGRDHGSAELSSRRRPRR